MTSELSPDQRPNPEEFERQIKAMFDPQASEEWQAVRESDARVRVNEHRIRRGLPLPKDRFVSLLSPEDVDVSWVARFVHELPLGVDVAVLEEK